MLPELDLPAFVDIDEPFFGLLSAPSRAEVALFLMSNARDAFSISEIARATKMSRLSAKSAVDALLKWGQIRIANPGFPRVRFAANEDSPITMAIDMLTSATVEVLWPHEDEFRNMADQVQDDWGAVLRERASARGAAAGSNNTAHLQVRPGARLRTAHARPAAPARAARRGAVRRPKR